MNAIWSVKGMEFFSLHLGKLLGWPVYIDIPLSDGIDTVLIVGMYDPPYYYHTLKMTQSAKRRVIAWCGTDVLMLRDPQLRLPEAFHICETPWLQEELYEKGVEAFVAMTPPPHHFSITPLSKDKTVGFYVGSDPDKYGTTMAMSVREVLTEAKFHFWQNGQYNDEEMAELVSKTRVYLRLAPHDGSAVTAREFMEAGRRVVCTVPLEGVSRCSPSDLLDIVLKVKRALTYTEPDEINAARWKRLNDPQAYLDTLYGLGVI